MDNFYRKLIKIASFITFSIFIFLISYILVKGLPSLNIDLFKLKYTSQNLSLFPSIVTTILVILLTLSLSIPIGVLTGFYLVEYKKVNKFIKIVRIASQTLAGVPSIVYGLFGSIFFVYRLKLGFSLASGVLTMTIMVLPLIIRSTEEALISVDDSLREASFALGAGRLRTIMKVVLPVAMPGILSGIILSIGRIIGETAALIFTLGTETQLPKNLKSSSRTLALHMYFLSTEGHNVDASFATGVVLLITVLILNYSSTKLTKKMLKEEN